MCEANMDIIFRINNFYLHPASPVALVHPSDYGFPQQRCAKQVFVYFDD